MQSLQDRNSIRRRSPLQLSHFPSDITILNQIPSYPRWNHIQLIPSQSTLSSPFLSTSIHQCILIKSNIQFHPPLHLQPTPPSPHSIHSNQYSSLFIKFKSIHFTPLLWQSRTTPSLSYSTIPFNYTRLSIETHITKHPFIQESPTITPTPQYSLPISHSPHYPLLHPFSNSSIFMNETITMWCGVVRNTSDNAIDVLWSRSAREESGLFIPPLILVERKVPSLRVLPCTLMVTRAFPTRHCAKGSVMRITIQICILQCESNTFWYGERIHSVVQGFVSNPTLTHAETDKEGSVRCSVKMDHGKCDCQETLERSVFSTAHTTTPFHFQYNHD